MSLKIKLKDINILNNTAFKIFIPRTRNNLNEIFGTVLLRSLGILAPETFQISVDFGGYERTMLFQELINKEFIEKSKRREGPIFEADESLIWPSKKFATLDRKVLELEPLSFSRLQNQSWLMKSENHVIHALNAHNKLQSAYLDFHQIWPKNRILLLPNDQKNNQFSMFILALLAMNGQHALANNNRKFYFNALLNSFEPIYYDGDLNLETRIRINQKVDQLLNVMDFSTITSNIFDNSRWENELRMAFLKRVLINKSEANVIFDKFLKQYKTNINYLIEKINSNEGTLKSVNKEEFLDYLLNTEQELNFYQDKYSITHRSGKQYMAIKHNKKNKLWETTILTVDELSSLLSNNIVRGVRSISLPLHNHTIPKFQTTTFPNFPMIKHTKDIEIDYRPDEKTINFTQKANDGWVLIDGADLTNWTVNFIGAGLSQPFEGEVANSKLNIFGLTGCLSLFNSKFSNSNVKAINANCEDAINIISSEGQIDQIFIENSRFDALDLDFSNIEIANAEIKNAGNDCIDFSSGHYLLKRAAVLNCDDKGISIGEKSFFYGQDLYIHKTDIGISVKDSSLAHLENVGTLESKICIEARIKKQEFGPAKVIAKNLQCEGLRNIEEGSIFEEIY